MSLKEIIIDRLGEKNVKSVFIDKNHTEHGTQAILVKVMFRAHNKVLVEHMFTFAKKNNMDNDHIADVIASYIKDKDGKSKNASKRSS